MLQDLHFCLSSSHNTVPVTRCTQWPAQQSVSHHCFFVFEWMQRQMLKYMKNINIFFVYTQQSLKVSLLKMLKALDFYWSGNILQMFFVWFWNKRICHFAWRAVRFPSGPDLNHPASFIQSHAQTKFFFLHKPMQGQSKALRSTIWDFWPHFQTYLKKKDFSVPGVFRGPKIVV